jgi:CubicO group peptidase (beta-lactamase class C family)
MTDVVLDARASDPRSLAWMQGTPPPPDKRVLWSAADHWRFPKTRWAFSHVRQLMPTARVDGGAGTPLPRAVDERLAELSVSPLDGREALTLDEALQATYTDAFMVVHRGEVILERWFGVTRPQTRHIAFSVTKSFVGTLAAGLIAEGALDVDAEVSRYVPELAASGFGHATVQQLMDMTTAVDFSEEYTDPKSGIGAYSAAIGFLPTGPDHTGALDIAAFLAGVAANGEHGAAFKYRTCNTDVLNWVISRVTGRALADNLSRYLWEPLGLQDADLLVDPVGTPFAGGGLCLRLEDLARFGESMRLGCAGLVPPAAITAIRRGGQPERFDVGRYPALRGWSYGSQWWHSHGVDGGFMARGIHGQLLWIAPGAELVVARFASHPVASNTANDSITQPLLQALGRALGA